MPIAWILSVGTTEYGTLLCFHPMPINLTRIDKVLPAPQQASSSSVYRKSHLSLYGRWSSPSVISVALFSTCSSVSMSLLYWVVQNWTQNSRCGLVIPDWKLRDHISQPAGDAVPRGCLWLLLPWVHVDGSCSPFHQGNYCKTTSLLASPHPILVHEVVPS